MLNYTKTTYNSSTQVNLKQKNLEACQMFINKNSKKLQFFLSLLNVWTKQYMIDPKRLNALSLHYSILKPFLILIFLYMKACIKMYIWTSIISNPKFLFYLYQRAKETWIILSNTEEVAFVYLFAFLLCFRYCCCLFHLSSVWSLMMESAVWNKHTISIFNISILFYLTPIHLP